MAGYSGTPLAKKLGIREHSNVALIGVPADVLNEIKAALGSCKIVKNGREPLDFVFLFSNSRAELQPQLSKSISVLAPDGMLWISWPKKASGVATDLDENVIRKMGLDAGVVDVKVCAVNDIWSGLKFVIRRKDRPGAAGAD